jgi:ketosteroid isomerase-like protein
MSREADLIRRFYTALGHRDHAAMAACYAPDARFSDPVFQDLRGPRIAAMWRMLCERGTDLRVAASHVEVEGDRGSARWEAWYTFSATRRPVHNVVQATFELRDGLIATHRDEFDLYRWARQALGPKGVLLGWTPFVQRAIRAQATGALEAFILKHPAG